MGMHCSLPMYTVNIEHRGLVATQYNPVILRLLEEKMPDEAETILTDIVSPLVGDHGAALLAEPVVKAHVENAAWDSAMIMIDKMLEQGILHSVLQQKRSSLPFFE